VIVEAQQEGQDADLLLPHSPSPRAVDHDVGVELRIDHVDRDAPARQVADVERTILEAHSEAAFLLQR